MQRTVLLFVGLVGALFPVLARAQAPVALSDWMTRIGDRFVVDTHANSGFLLHEDGTYTTFAVVTGQQRTVHYIGKTYYAATPAQSWTAETVEVKGDRVTFGPTGRFLRLFDEDGRRTSYGIHGHRDAAEMLASVSSKRYRSMGCIIVSEQALNVIERMFEEIGPFPVETTRGEIALR